MKKNFRIKKITVVCAAVVAAAMALVLSTSAMGMWSLSDLIDRVFPDRNDEIQPYAFSVELSDGSTQQFMLSTGNFICDGNNLVTEFLINKIDGSEFTQEEFGTLSFNDWLVFPDITGMDSEIRNGGADYQVSDDGLTFIITRTYNNLPRKINSGDELQIKISGVQKWTVSNDNGDADLQTIDDGTVFFNFTVPEIPAPIPLVFKNENGEKVFEAELTRLSMTAVADEPVFSGYELMPDDIYELIPDDISDYDAQIQWLMFNIATPKFYDENMNPTNNEFNGYNCMTGFSGQNAHILFNEDPKIEEAKYVKWFDCIAEIPGMSE
ncbi:MAG: hypothetical protein K2N71_11740 [Oscillospiraceae bacterium]|nr:hypothetical protein [Oscillospiraceae bacterium]